MPSHDDLKRALMDPKIPSFADQLGTLYPSKTRAELSSMLRMWIRERSPADASRLIRTALAGGPDGEALIMHSCRAAAQRDKYYGRGGAR